MDLYDRLSALATKVEQQRADIETEEATKNAFIMPFLSSVLGYDVFDPTEVVPEFTADVGVKKGEKIDYAIVHDGKVQILVECKKIGAPLKVEHASQLFRYFATTNARIAVLTNGQVYQFYTDLEHQNRMDQKPFLVLDLLDIDKMLVPEVEKMTKSSFDLDSVMGAAEELKYISLLKKEISVEFQEPSVDLVKLLTSRVYDGQFNAKTREQFIPLVSKACKQFLTDQVNARLNTALGAGAVAAPAPVVVDSSVAETELTSQVAAQDVDDTPQDEIVTTMEEIEGFQIVRAIACEILKAQRIVYRDAKSYFAILADDNNRKPLARLHFNRRQKYLGLFDEEKRENRVPIDSLEQIFEHAAAIRESAQRYV